MSKVRITDNMAKIGREAVTKANIALRLMASAVVVESTPKTPKREGDLRLNVLKQVIGLNASVTWDMPYAEIQENTQFKNYTTPGTGPHFAENAVKQVVGESTKYFRQAGIK